MFKPNENYLQNCINTLTNHNHLRYNCEGKNCTGLQTRYADTFNLRFFAYILWLVRLVSVS